MKKYLQLGEEEAIVRSGIWFYPTYKLISYCGCFHGCWLKTWDSWIRNTALSHSWHSTQPGISTLSLAPLSSSPAHMGQYAQMDSVHRAVCITATGHWLWGTHCFLKIKQYASLCFVWGMPLPYPLRREAKFKYILDSKLD